VTSKLKALIGCSSHHVQRAGHIVSAQLQAAQNNKLFSLNYITASGHYFYIEINISQYFQTQPSPYCEILIYDPGLSVIEVANAKICGGLSATIYGAPCEHR